MWPQLTHTVIRTTLLFTKFTDITLDITAGKEATGLLINITPTLNY